MYKLPIKHILSVFVIVLVVLMFRRFDGFVNPQLWAEDGTVFLQQYIDMGAKSIITPYAGYLHFLPRLIVYFYGLLSVNLLYIPLLYAVTCVVILLLLAFKFLNSATNLSLQNKIVFATIFLYVPVGTEIFMNITNLIWFSALYLVDFLLMGYKQYETSRYKVPIIFMVFIAALTGPFSLLLSPIIVLIIFIERKTIKLNQLLPMIIIMLGGLIQLVCIKTSGNGISRAVPGNPEKYHLLKLIEFNISDLAFASKGLWPDMSDGLKTIISMFLFCGLLYIISKSYIKINLQRKYILILAPVVFLGSFVVSFWPMETIALAFGCPRYYFVPYVCIAWIFIIGHDKQIVTKDIVIYGFYFLLHAKSMSESLPDKEWKKQILEYQSGNRNQIEINPNGWNLNLSNHKK